MKTYQCIGCLLLAITLFGCGESDSNSSSADQDETVYVCTETDEVFRLAAQEASVLNPKTGRATLAKAMYCEECQKWHPIPPLEAVGGNAALIRCPIHQTPLSPVETAPVETAETLSSP